MIKETLENKISRTDFSLTGIKEWNSPARLTRYLEMKM